MNCPAVAAELIFTQLEFHKEKRMRVGLKKYFKKQWLKTQHIWRKSITKGPPKKLCEPCKDKPDVIYAKMHLIKPLKSESKEQVLKAVQEKRHITCKPQRSKEVAHFFQQVKGLPVLNSVSVEIICQELQVNKNILKTMENQMNLLLLKVD